MNNSARRWWSSCSCHAPRLVSYHVPRALARATGCAIWPVMSSERWMLFPISCCCCCHRRRCWVVICWCLFCYRPDIGKWCQILLYVTWLLGSRYRQLDRSCDWAISAACERLSLGRPLFPCFHFGSHNRRLSLINCPLWTGSINKPSFCYPITKASC